MAEHFAGCMKACPDCLCNTCAKDDGDTCCVEVSSQCPVRKCPYYEEENKQ